MTPVERTGRRGPAAAWWAMLVALLAPVVGWTHEIGTTQVAAKFAGADGYRITITTDARTLLARLESAAGRPRSEPASAAELGRALADLCDRIPHQLAIIFDAKPSVPRADCAVDGAPDVAGMRTPAVIVTLRGEIPSGARTVRWRYDLTFASYALTVAAASGAPSAQTLWLEGGEESPPQALAAFAQPSLLAQAGTYFKLGFTHIVPLGADHILFVLGIFLLSRRPRELIWQVSAFTVAHTITLGLGLYDLVTLPASVVEPLIALSIVYVAVENLATPRFRARRVALVFAFGLLHGLGFAGVLREMAFGQAQMLTSLLAFNVGVEAGQLAVIGTALLVTRRFAHDSDRYRRWVATPASALIALAGLLWTVQRLA